MLEGHLLLSEGKTEQAAIRLKEAESAWERARMRLHQASIRRRLVEIGAEKSAEIADAGQETRGISNPSKMFNCYVPSVRH